MTKGEGGKKSQKIDDVFYEQPLIRMENQPFLKPANEEGLSYPKHN